MFHTVPICSVYSLDESDFSVCKSVDEEYPLWKGESYVFFTLNLKSETSVQTTSITSYCY